MQAEELFQANPALTILGITLVLQTIHYEWRKFLIPSKR